MSAARTLIFLFLLGCNNTSTPNTLPSEDGVSLWNVELGEVVYGLKLAEGWEQARLLPPPLNIEGGWTDSISAMSNGKEMLFAYSKIDFSKFHYSHGQIRELSGRDRPEQFGERFKIFQASFKNSEWKIFLHPANVLNPNLDLTSPSLNDNQDVIMFAMWGENGRSDSDLYFSKLIEGTWGRHDPLPFNSMCDDDNPFALGSFNSKISIYFESKRIDPDASSCGMKRRLYYAIYENNKFGPVMEIPEVNGLSSGDDDSQPMLTPDDNRIFWTGIRENESYGIYTAEKNSKGIFENVRPIIEPQFQGPFVGNVVLVGEPNLVEFEEGEMLLFMCGVATSESNGSPTGADLKICASKRKITTID